MQIITFDLKFSTDIEESDLRNSIVRCELASSTYKFYDIDISITHATMRNEYPIPIVTPDQPVVLELVRLQSYEVLITIKSELDALDKPLDDLSITFQSMTQFTNQSVVPLLNKYQPLHNYYDGAGSLLDDLNYNSAFTTTKLNFHSKSIVDLRLQLSYDRSINMIFTDDINPARLVNSRFRTNEEISTAELAERRSKKDTNTYSDQNFTRTELIPRYSGIPKLEYMGEESGGQLFGGGYRYYFRYITADGAETDVIEESRLVEVHHGNNPTNSYSAKINEKVSKTVKFKLSNLDTSFYGVRAYYTHTSGELAAIPRSWRIVAPFDINEIGESIIVHSGYEQLDEVPNEVISIAYSKIAKSKTLDISNDRLLLGNSDVASVYDPVLASLASRVYIQESTFNITQGIDPRGTNNDNYSNSKVSYEKLGYWRGETYELGAVFITDEGLSPVYTFQGIDNFYGDAEYDEAYFGSIDKTFGLQGQNSLGVYRTGDDMDKFWEIDPDSRLRLAFNGTKLQIDPTPLIGYTGVYERYSIAEDVGLTILYEKIKKEYYLVGKATVDVASGNSVYTIEGDFPVPTSTVVFQFTNIDGTGGQLILPFGASWLDCSQPVKERTDFTDQTGPTRVESPIRGFFIVRRKRKPDKLIQGILTPSAAIPTSSVYIADQLIAGPGTWTGVGTQSGVLGSNVTFVPAPYCMSPWGSEKVFTGRMFTYEDETQEVTEQTSRGSGSADFQIRAPILNYSAMNAFSLYSPDTDCLPTEAATKFSGNKLGIRIRNTPFDVDFERVTYTARINTSLMRHIEIDGPYERQTEGFKIKQFPAEVSYVEAGSLRHGDKSFSAKSDRTMALFTHESIKTFQTLDFTYYMTAEKDQNPFWDDDYNGAEPLAAFKAVCEGVPRDSDTKQPKLDSDVMEDRTPSVAVNYGRYLGIRLEEKGGDFLKPLNMKVKLKSDTNETINNYQTNINYQTSLRADKILDIGSEDGNYYGFISEVYDNPEGSPLRSVDWPTKYKSDEDTEYIAISRRYNVDEFSIADTELLDIYGGDCYVGIQWKQVWSPLGVPEAPQVNDMEPYRADRKALGMLGYGFAIPIPSQANSNFFVRMPERYSVTEYKIYGEDRLYLPVRTNVRGNRQLETGMYDHGMSVNGQSNNKLFRLNVNFPYVEEVYPNRVYASEPSVSQDFLNGFTAFQGLNYKDYNSELGALIKLQTLNNVTFAVFYGGIATIGVSERSMVSQDTGGVFIDNAQVLANRSNTISSEYGTQHQHSITTSSNYLYGVDVIKKRVWRTDGKGIELISFFKIQKRLESIIRSLQEEVNALDGDWFDVVSNYDITKGDVYFNFILHKGSDRSTSIVRTLVYNEIVNFWTSETNDHRQFIFDIKGNKLAFGAAENKDALYQYIGEDPEEQGKFYNKFFGSVYDTEVGFNVLNAQSESKIFENMYIVGNKTLPTNVLYKTDKIRDPKPQVLLPMSNVVYIIPGVVLQGIPGEYKFSSNTVSINNWNGEPFGIGDFFSVTGDDGKIYTFTCMRVDETDKEIWVDVALPTLFTDKTMTFGYPNSLRLSNAIYEDGFTKIVCSLDPNGLSSEYRPYGKWADVKLTYKGMAPMYLDSVISTYNLNSS